MWHPVSSAPGVWFLLPTPKLTTPEEQQEGCIIYLSSRGRKPGGPQEQILTAPDEWGENGK